MITAITSQVWIEKDIRYRDPACRAGKLYPLEVRESFLSTSAGLSEGVPRPVLGEEYTSVPDIVAASMNAILEGFGVPTEAYTSGSPTISMAVMNTVLVTFDGGLEKITSSAPTISNGDMQIQRIRYTRGIAEKYLSTSPTISGGTMNAG